MSSVLVYLVVSLGTVCIQSVALARLSRAHPVEPAGGIVRSGLARTARCRVAVGGLYVLYGLGVLSQRLPRPATVGLGVYTFVQLVWWANGLLDVRMQRRITREGRE